MSSSHSPKPKSTPNASKSSSHSPRGDTSSPRSTLIAKSQSLLKRSFSPQAGDHKCTNCEKHFSLTTRRHHCNYCGKAFCADCSNYRFELDYFKHHHMERVCENCYFYLMDLAVGEQGSNLPHPDYDQVKSELLHDVENVLKVDESKWKLTRDTKGVMIWKLPLASSHIYCFRSSVIVEEELEPVWRIYQQDSLWKNWEPDLGARLIETVSETETVTYFTYRFPAIIENRDSCLFSFFKRGTFSDPNKNAISLYSKTVDHPKCPKTSNFVRCDWTFSYTTLESTEHNGKVCTKLTTIVHMDPRGMVPAFLVNSILSVAINSILEMKSWLEAHARTYPEA